MSRGIKFRIWKKSIKKYIDLTTFTITNDGEITAVVYSNILEPVLNKDDYILEQYTGLKDKNGVDIYEGDIVGIYNYYYNDETGEDEPGELEPWGTIVYEAPAFGLWGEPIYGNEDKHFFEVTSEMVVIGNIHENPELFGGEDETN